MITVKDSPSLRKRIARAVLDDLEDRRGIKWELANIKESPEIYAEIEETIGDLVLEVLQSHQEKCWCGAWELNGEDDPNCYKHGYEERR